MIHSEESVRSITIGLLLGLVLASIEQTVVSTAMPTIVKELGGLSFYSWVFSIYMLTSTAAMPLYGKLADMYGRRKMMLTGLFLFLAGSILCGLSGSMAELIVYRGIQGLGAGALMPIAFTIAGDIYPPDKRGKFMGLFSAVFILSSICGPTVGGLLVQYFSWNAIFYLNLPLGVPAFLILAFSLKEKLGGGKRRVDWLGALTITGAVVSILLALVLGGEDQGSEQVYNWTSAPIIGLFSAGILLLGLFLWIETKAQEPIVPLRLFQIRAVSASGLSGFFVSAAIFGAIAYIPLYVQGVAGASPSAAGYSLVPLMLASAVTSTVSGRLMNRLSYRAILVPSLILTGIGFFLLCGMTAETSVIQLIVNMVITGLGMGAIFPTLGTAAQSSVDASMRGVATSSNQFFRSVGGTIGVSVLGTLLAERMESGLLRLDHERALPADQLPQLADPQVLLDAQSRVSLPHETLLELQHVFSDALSLVFAAGLVFVCLSLLAGLFLGSARLVKPSKG